MAQVNNNELICCVKCNGQFDRVDQVPIKLSCLHSFCRPCLKQTVDPDHKLTCPVCLKTQTIEGDIDALPADLRIMKMIGLISNKIKDTCLQHESHLYFFCAKCKTPICHDCTVLNHPKEQKHAIIEISEAFENYAPKFDALERFGQSVADAMKVKIETYKNELNDLERAHRNLKGDISYKFRYYRSLLAQREEDVRKRAETLIHEQREEIEHACIVIEDKLNYLNILREQFKIVRSNNDTRLVFQVYQEFKDCEDFFNCLMKPERMDFFKKYIFTDAKEEQLLDLLKEAGNVELDKHNVFEIIELVYDLEVSIMTS
ncbi:unnamed protein product [Lymnaea stagnalis]|uniref:Uncharacterized protein n=1 Tax=Lymnaea stagnalis TaxID=6523 RepID=A0AAV2HHU8_LYMST